MVVQVVGARSRQAQELAILKLYAVLSQAHFVKQQAEEWQGAFLGILALGFPLLLKHTAEIVIHQDKGYSDMVRLCLCCNAAQSLALSLAKLLAKSFAKLKCSEFCSLSVWQCRH